MVTAGEALRRMLSDLGPLGPSGSERVALAAAAGRVPRRAIHSRTPVPAFARAAMDGYAVRACDTRGAAAEHPVGLPVTAQVLAGYRLEHTPPPTSAVRIATGAPLPDGMDAILPLEQVARATPAHITLTRPIVPGTHVIPPGELLAMGGTVVAGGRPLGPAAIGALAAAGIGDVEVGRRPCVVLLTTGDELREPGDGTGTAGVYDANAPMLLAGCAAAGADVRHGGNIRDDAAAVRSALAAAVATGADLVLTTGGVSVGPADFIPEAWRELGALELFWRVAIKPGKPVYAGSIGRTAVVGLSGSPTACWAAFTLLVAPLLRTWSGWDHPFPAANLLRLKAPLATRGDALRLTWARADDASGTVTPCASTPSGTMAAMAAADSLVLQAVGSPALATGTPVWSLRIDPVGAPAATALPELLDRLSRPHASPARQPPRPAAPVGICAFSGRSGHGKTTLIEALVKRLHACGEQVAILKHHGHGMPLDAPGKDSWRLRMAGARLVAVAGKGGYLLTAASPVEMEPEAWLAAMREDAAAQGCSWLFIEGFHAMHLPRVEVVGGAAQPAVQGSPSDGLFLVAAAHPAQTPAPPGVPVVSRDDVDGILAAIRVQTAAAR